MRFLHSKLFVGLTCFILGVGAGVLVQKIPRRAHEQMSQAKNEPESFDPFQQMRQMQKQMMKQMEEAEAGGIWGDQQAQADDPKIHEREDKDYVYYDISTRDIGKDKLKVRVADGQISVSGQIEKNSDDDGNSAFFSSSFHRSFPVPPEVDANKVQMEQNQDQLTLKFPKLQA